MNYFGLNPNGVNEISQSVVAIYTNGVEALKISGSNVDISKNTIISGSLTVTGSAYLTLNSIPAGDSDQFLILNTSTNRIERKTSSTVAGQAYLHTQSSAAATWVVNHALNYQYPAITIWDNNGNVIIPQQIAATDSNNITITFSTSRSGYAHVSVGGGMPAGIQLSNAGKHLRIDSTGGNVEWAHISPYTGSFVISGSSTVTGSLNITGSVGIVNALLDNSQVSSTTTGINVISSIVTGSYTSAFYNYTVSSGSNARSGQVITVWNGSSIQYTEVTTLDVGNTNDIVVSSRLSGSYAQLITSASTSAWKVKTLSNLL